MRPVNHIDEVESLSGVKIKSECSCYFTVFHSAVYLSPFLRYVTKEDLEIQ